MAWPTTPVSTVNVDASSDRISLARADIKDSFDKLNDIIDHGPNLSDLDDVNIPSPATDQVLTYDGAQWIAADASGGGLTELLDDTSPQCGGDLDMNGRLLFDSTRGIVYISDSIITRGSHEHRYTSDGPGVFGRLTTQMQTTTKAQVVSNSNATAGLELRSDAGPVTLVGNAGVQLGSVLNTMGYSITDTVNSYVRLAVPVVAVGDIKTYQSASGATGPFILLHQINSTTAQISSSSTDLNILSTASGGRVQITELALSQSTGTPSNTSTPTGYMDITINGTTRYVPYYT